MTIEGDLTGGGNRRMVMTTNTSIWIAAEFVILCQSTG